MSTYTFQKKLLTVAIAAAILPTMANAAEPVAKFTVTPTHAATAPAEITLDGTASTDDGEIKHYKWTSLAGQIKEGATASMTFDTAGSYPIILTVTDDEGLAHSTYKTVTVGENSCEGHATYSAETGILHIPYVDIPTLPYIGGNHAPSDKKVAVAEVNLQLIYASNLFEIENINVLYEDVNVNDPQKCHGIYTLNGELVLPYIDMPLVTMLNGIPIPLGVETFEGKLGLLPFSDLFTINEVRPVESSDNPIPDPDPDPDTCTLDPNGINAFEAVLMEPYLVFEAINDMILVDYWTGSLWPNPLTDSITIPTMTYTESMLSGAPNLSIIATMKDQDELVASLAAFGISEACIDEIGGKTIEFTYSDATNNWSCSTDIPEQHLDLFPMTCSN